MKKIHYVILAGSLAILMAAGTASATVATETPRERVTERKEVRERVQDVREQAQQNRVEVKNRLEERRQQFVRNYVKHIVDVLENAVERMGNVANRIGSRLDKLAEQGVSVTDSRAKLAEARTKIAEAKTAVAGITAAAEAVLVSDDPKGSFASAKTIINAAREKVKAAHTALVDVINSIKPGTVRATTSPETSP